MDKKAKEIFDKIVSQYNPYYDEKNNEYYRIDYVIAVTDISTNRIKFVDYNSNSLVKDIREATRFSKLAAKDYMSCMGKQYPYYAFIPVKNVLHIKELGWNWNEYYENNQRKRS